MTEKKDKKFFKHCNCAECGQLSEVLEGVVSVLEDGEKKAKSIDERVPLGLVLSTLADILTFMFVGDVQGVKVASASAAFLKEFITQEAASQVMKSDLADAMSSAGGSMSPFGPQVMSMSLEDAPPEVQEALKNIIARRGGGGGDPGNFH